MRMECGKKGKEDIGDIIQDYFAGLFASDHSIDMEGALLRISHCVSEEMNENLVKATTSEEVQEALFAMHPIKS